MWLELLARLRLWGKFFLKHGDPGPAPARPVNALYFPQSLPQPSSPDPISHARWLQILILETVPEK